MDSGTPDEVPGSAQRRLTVAKWLGDLSLRTRLVLLVALVVATVIGVEAYLELRVFERSVERDLREGARLTATAVADELELRSEPLDPIELAASLHEFIQAAPSVRSISVVTLGPDGPSAFASTSSIERREALRLGAQAILTGQTVWNESLETATVAVPAVRSDSTFGAIAVTISLSAVQQLRTRGRLVALGFAPAAIVLLTLLVDQLMRRFVHRPVRNIRDTMRRAGAGDLQARATMVRRDEIGAVAHGLNEMLDELQALHGDLQQRVAEKTAELVAKNEELGGSYRRMLALREELARAEQLSAVGHMAANVAHQVGTPLNLISGYVQMMMQEPDSEPRSRRRLEIVREQIAKVDSIVRTLLNRASRPAPKTPTDLAPLLMRVSDLARPKLASAGVTLHLNQPSALTPVLADIEALELALLSLITNALDAMPVGGTLSIEARDTGEAVRIVVADTGGGIPADLLPKIFEPWVTTKAVGHGSGLGLSITREVIESHGGSIAAESRPGGGAMFTIDLPRAARPAAVS